MKPFNILRFAKPNTANNVTLYAVNASHYVIDPENASCGFTVGSGSKQMTQSPPLTTLGTWLVNDVVSNYEVRLVPTVGNVSSGPTNTWLSMSSDRTWTLSRGIIGESSFSGILQMRRTSDSVIVATSNVNLTATVDF